MRSVAVLVVLAGVAVLGLCHVRIKRDFMYVSSANDTDADCFEASNSKCNAKWKESFEYSLNMSLTDFYEFPFHPLILDHSSFLLYCTLAEQKTHCYLEECGDQSADTVFSPSNFVCDFKRQLFTEVRQCLAESEPITFLKCDQACHDKMIPPQSKNSVDDEDDEKATSVFSAGELVTYERELETLCAFQQCYLQCMVPVLKETCSPSLASRAISLVQSFVKWHAVDIYEWHVSSDRLDSLAPSCAALAEKDKLNEDKVLQLISRI